MKRDEALQKLKEAEADLRAQGVARAALFGSVARGENRPDSDIDILVEIAPEARIGLFQVIAHPIQLIEMSSNSGSEDACSTKALFEKIESKQHVALCFG